MGFRFQRRIRIAPGISLNLSKSGVSTSFGVRGARVTVGRRGTYANIGLPGTGISYRTRIDGGGSRRPSGTTGSSAGQRDTPRIPGGRPHSPYFRSPASLPGKTPSQGFTLVQSADLKHLGSRALDSIRADILQGRTERAEVVALIARHRSKQRRLGFWRTVSKVTMLYWLWPGLGARLRSRADALAEEGAALAVRREATYYELDIRLSGPGQQAWDRLSTAFDRAAQSHRIKDYVGHRAVDRQAIRSSYQSEFEGRPVALTRTPLEDVVCPLTPLRLGNANGGDLLLYPTFLVIDGRGGDFSLLDYGDLTLEHQAQPVIETGEPPADGHVIAYAWKYANKDGGPDRRFRDNEQYPIVRYGSMTLRSTTGLNERYLLSDFAASQALADALEAYRAYVGSHPSSQLAGVSG